MKTLDRLNLAENTLVIFCSDNGPVLDDGYADDAVEKIGRHRAGGPFRGGKYSVLEGGTRTPFITRWKGRIKPAVEDKAVVSTIDLVASVGALTETPLPQDAYLDSHDVMGALLGEDGAKGREHLIQQDNGRAGNYGYRKGDWKLQRHEKGTARNVVVEAKLANTKVPKHRLFNLAEDPGETRNLIEKHPDIAKKMIEELDAHIKAGRTRS